MRPYMLNLWLKCQWISISNISASSSDFVGVAFGVGAVSALAFLIAEPSGGEALTVHLEALGLVALAY